MGAQSWTWPGCFPMHELAIAQNILEIVQQSVPVERAAMVRSVGIRVGKLSGIVPDSLQFCFSVIVSDTNMPRAYLTIEQVPTISRCRDCMLRFAVEDFAFTCPGCRSANLELISGKELEIVEIELEDPNDESI